MAPRTWRSPCAASTGALGAAGKPAPGRTSPYGGLHWLFSGRGPWLGGGRGQQGLPSSILPFFFTPSHIFFKLISSSLFLDFLFPYGV